MKKSTTGTGKNWRLTISMILLTVLLIGCGADKQITPADSDKPLKSIDVARYFDKKSIYLHKITDLTEASDPDKLLGRPGQYTSKTTFEIDENICSIEVFNNKTDLKSREKSIKKENDKQYIYSNENILTYLPYDVTPSDAKSIEKSLSKINSQQKKEFKKDESKGFGIKITDFDKSVDDIIESDEILIFLSVERGESEESDKDFSRIDTFSLVAVADNVDTFSKEFHSYVDYNSNNDITHICAFIPEIGITENNLTEYSENYWYSTYCIVIMNALDKNTDLKTLDNLASKIADNYQKENFELEYGKYKITSSYDADLHETIIHFQLSDN